MPFFARKEELSDTLLEPVLFEKVDPDEDDEEEEDEEDEEGVSEDDESELEPELDEDELEDDEDALHDRFLLFLSLDARFVFFVLLGVAEAPAMSATCLFARTAFASARSLPAATWCLL